MSKDFNFDQFFKKLIEQFDESIIKAYSNSLKELREHTNMTQRELAEATGIPHQSISVYERGTTLPTVLQAYKIALYFKLTIEDFIEYGIKDDSIEKEYNSITDKYDALNKE